MNLRHLARLTDLSPSAVSLALRDSPKISLATRKRVRRLAEKMGYQPDANVVAMMSQLRKPHGLRQQACFGVISFYEQPQPWEDSPHLARIYDGMKRRAAELGYRLEPVWLRAPGMSYGRIAEILRTRAIEGLLCFGSPDFDQPFPPELAGPAVVTVGLSIRPPMHRVTSHFYNDTLTALERVHALGYRRPGLVLGAYEETRSALAHSSAYLGWCEHKHSRSGLRPDHRVSRPASTGSAQPSLAAVGQPAGGRRQSAGQPAGLPPTAHVQPRSRHSPGLLEKALPILRLADVEPEPLGQWLSKNEPDVMLFVHLPEKIPQLRGALQQLRVRVPRDLGVAVLSHLVEDTGFSGLQQNQPLIGSWAVELLAARIANRDLGPPANPRIEMVESEWIDGDSLTGRRAKVSRIT